MAVTAVPFGQSFKNLGLGKFDFSSDTLKCLLTTSDYQPGGSAINHEFVSQVTNEVSGSNYTAGGVTLTGLTWLRDATNNWVVLSCNPPQWSSATFTARRGVIYKDTGDPATSPLLSYVDFGANANPQASNFTITFTNGVYRLRVYGT